MKKLNIPPYHLFERGGMKFVFDIATTTLLRIDDAAFDVLHEGLDDASNEEIMRKLGAKYGADTVGNVLAEIEFLREQNFFPKEVYTYDEKDDEALVQRLVRMSTNKIELFLAESCNLRCKYCYVDSNEALGSGLMSEEVAKKGIDFIFERGKNANEIHITFFGGEPLMNKPVLRSAIAYSQRLGKERGKTVRYIMTTNATLMDDEIIGYIKRYNFGLMISLDGPPDVHDNVRPFANGRGSFEAAARNIKKLMARRRTVTVRCTLSNQCLDKVRIVKFLEDFGFTRIGFCRAIGKSYGRGEYDIGPEENRILKEQDDILLERFFDQMRKGERIIYNPTEGFIEDMHNRSIRRLRCGVGRGCATVGIDGSIYPCHRYVGMKEYIIGDVYSGVDSEKYADYLRDYLSTRKKCESCWAINLCGGACPWYVAHDDGKCRPPQEWWCNDIRSGIEEGAIIYERIRTELPDYFEECVKRAEKEQEEETVHTQGKPTPTDKPGRYFKEQTFTIR